MLFGTALNMQRWLSVQNCNAYHIVLHTDGDGSRAGEHARERAGGGEQLVLHLAAERKSNWSLN